MIGSICGPRSFAPGNSPMRAGSKRPFLFVPHASKYRLSAKQTYNNLINRNPFCENQLEFQMLLIGQYFITEEVILQNVFWPRKMTDLLGSIRPYSTFTPTAISCSRSFLIRSRSSAARSNSCFFAAARISFSRCSITRGISTAEIYSASSSAATGTVK
jgi:hypothetical protein